MTVRQLFAPALVLTLLLAGCAPSLPPTESTAPTATASASESPEPTPTAERADFGFTFYKEAQLGSTAAEMSAALGFSVAGPAECPNYLPLDGTTDSITWYFTDDLGHGFAVFYSQARSGIGVYPRNAEGVGIGSTQAELLAGYPSAVVGTTHDLGAGDITTVTVDDPSSDSQYVFGFSSGSSTVDLLQWGLLAGNQWSHLCGGF